MSNISHIALTCGQCKHFQHRGEGMGFCTKTTVREFSETATLTLYAIQSISDPACQKFSDRATWRDS